MKTKFFFNARWLLVVALATIFSTNVWGETVTLTYAYNSDYNDMWYGNMSDASSYWKLTNGTSVFSVPISRQPTSNITITISIAYFGKGTEGLEKISASGTESSSNWTLAETTPASHSGSTYASRSFTITKNANPTTLAGLDITFKTNSGKALRVNSIQVSYTADAACSGDPTIGAASLSGNFNSGGVTSLTNTITFATSSCNAYSGCAWVDYGFVWNTSTNPTTSNNKMQKGTSGTATSWNMTSPSTFSVGTTYYVRAYGKNGKSGAAFKYSSSTMSFTPRSVTFNSNGGSAVATKYIKSGGTITAPTAPTNGNYTFGGWYTDAGLTTPVNWSSTISENKTYYAKWSCEKHITVSWSAPSHGSIVVHQGNSADGPVLSSGAVLDNCEQAQIYVVCTPDDGYGVSSFSATNSQAHTGTTNILTFYTVNTTASSTITVTFAPMYTVTWMVNGSSYTTGGPTTQLSEGQHVTTLPTAPNPASYCGDKFVGWTDAAGGAYVHGTSNLYTTASGFPNATGNQTFYAVFADYDE